MSAVPLEGLGALARSLSSLPHEPDMRHSSSYGSGEMAGRLTSTETLRPELWSELPDALIRIIIHKVLVDLPFARHWSFCCDSSRWKDFLLSNRYLLHYGMGRCIIFNSRRGKWEPVSLDFCPLVWKEWSEYLRLVSADGGLLTFLNYLNDQYFVCNLLTQRYINLGELRSLRTSTNATVVTVALHTEDSPIALSSPAPCSASKLFMVHHDCCVNGNEKPFQLVAVRYDTGILAVLDSRIPGLRTVDTSRRGDFWCIVNGPTLQSPQAVILGFVTDSKGSEVLIYHLEERDFRWTKMETLLHAIKSTSKVLAICSDCEAQMKFFGVHGTALEMTLVELPCPTLPPSLQSVTVTLAVPEHLKWWQYKHFYLVVLCSAEGDSVDYIAHLGGGEVPGPWGCLDAISVWRDGQVSDWTYIRPPPEGVIMATQEFYFFMPGEAGPP